MEQPINTGGVKVVAVTHRNSSVLHSMNVYIHHELTPEREQELAALLEGLVLRAITTWARL